MGWGDAAIGVCVGRWGAGAGGRVSSSLAGCFGSRPGSGWAPISHLILPSLYSDLHFKQQQRRDLEASRSKEEICALAMYVGMAYTVGPRIPILSLLILCGGAQSQPALCVACARGVRTSRRKSRREKEREEVAGCCRTHLLLQPRQAASPTGSGQRQAGRNREKKKKTKKKKKDSVECEARQLSLAFPQDLHISQLV